MRTLFGTWFATQYRLDAVWVLIVLAIVALLVFIFGWRRR